MKNFSKRFIVGILGISLILLMLLAIILLVYNTYGSKGICILIGIPVLIGASIDIKGGK